jgi:hypothetical protein
VKRGGRRGPAVSGAAAGGRRAPAVQDHLLDLGVGAVLQAGGIVGQVAAVQAVRRQ